MYRPGHGLLLPLLLLSAALSSHLSLFPPAEATTLLAPRVRKELRHLSSTQYRLLIKALSTMMAVPTPAGRILYGPKYKEYDYFIVKHAVSVLDPRGDQGHLSPAFLTFHRAWLLELENCLRAIEPDLDGLFYLDFTRDLFGGLYYGTAKSAFSNKYLGSGNCQSGPGDSCAVRDGALALRKVSYFNHEVYGKYAWIYNGSYTTGLLRGPTNSIASRDVVRYYAGNASTIQVPPPYQSYKDNVWYNPTFGIQKGLNWGLTTAQLRRCINAKAYPSWMDWQFCLSPDYIVQPPSSVIARFANTNATVYHLGVHAIIGGYLEDGTVADFSDVTSSPNDPLAFIGHHCFIDRLAMQWQEAALIQNSSMGEPNVMWRFPKGPSEFPSWPGVFLHDVVNSNFPFDDLFRGKNATHYDMINLGRPGPGKLYTYV